MSDRKERPPLLQRKEQQIREQRTIDAMRNGLMGGQGKLARIAIAFGEPMIRQGSSKFEQTFLPDFDEIPDEDAIPIMDMEDASHQIGWHFDGLRRGVHMEISWNEETRDLKCYWRGYLVYREFGNELDGYVPDKEGWEKIVEELYESTRKKERTNRKEQAKFVNVAARRQQKEFLDEMKLKWGI